MKVVLSIAGSDSSGGAGIQADLKTFEAFGVFGCTAITVLTAQNTTGVTQVQPISVEFLQAQLDAIQEDFTLSAIKVGMLFNKEIIDTVAKFLEHHKDIPIVVDPVGISKAGSPLLQDDAMHALPKLFTYATVVTPNTYEAKQLFDYEFGDSESLQALKSTTTPILVKNAHIEKGDVMMSVDQLFAHHKRRIFETPLVKTNNLHGTGCSFSSAVAACLALGDSLEEAITKAKDFINRALEHAPNIGKGPGPIHHKKGIKHA